MFINLWLSGIKLWLLGKISVRFVRNSLYVSLGTFFRKNHFFKTVLHFHPYHLTRKKIKFIRRIFGKVVKIPFYVIRRRFSGKPILFREKLYVLITFGNSNKITQIFLQKKGKLSTLNCICLVERHSWSFSLWMEIYSNHFFSDSDRRNFKTQYEKFEVVSKALFDVSIGL